MAAAKKTPTRKTTSGTTPRPRLPSLHAAAKKDNTFLDLVHDLVRQIPRGKVTSYGAIAASLGAATPRMAGWAMRTPPRSSKALPAHRVLSSTGELSGRHHFNPPGKMQQMLEKEGIVVKNNKVVNFSQLFWDPAVEL
jgi:methylated-DNA-protein-cysteine methyltransferase related protein